MKLSVRPALLALAAAGAILSAAALAPTQAVAQGGTARVVSACGTTGLTYAAGVNYPITQDTTGKLCTNTGGGGGGGDASAANQASQITIETAISAALGSATASPAANTLADRLKTINTTLGSPFQAGGSIGNTAFGATQSGAWLNGVKGIDGSTIASGSNLFPVGTDGVTDAVVYSDSVSSAATGRTASAIGYSTGSIQITANVSGNTIAVECSNDGGTHWDAISMRATAASNSGTQGGNVAVTAGTYRFVVPCLQVRWRVSTFVSGTTSISMVLKRGGSDPTGEVFVDGTVTVSSTSKPATSGGMLTCRLGQAATTNAATCKVSAGLVYSGLFCNSNAAFRYVKTYEKATAPTVGTDTPKEVVAIPPSACASLQSNDIGRTYVTGISIAVTTGAADSDNTAPGANEVTGQLTYN